MQYIQLTFLIPALVVLLTLFVVKVVVFIIVI